MNEGRLPDYLDHIRQAATDACSFVEGQDKADFLADIHFDYRLAIAAGLDLHQFRALLAFYHKVGQIARKHNRPVRLDTDQRMNRFLAKHFEGNEKRVLSALELFGVKHPPEDQLSQKVGYHISLLGLLLMIVLMKEKI